MSVTVYKDLQGDLYGFCSRVCVNFWLHYVRDPIGALHKRPEPPLDVACGCWWCGEDLMNKEGIQWLD